MACPKTIKEMKSVLIDIFKSDQVRIIPFIVGSPGIGKSQIVAQAAQECGKEIRDIRLAQFDPVDIRGIPALDKKTMESVWCKPDIFPNKNQTNVVLFFDELDKAQPAVQNAALQLFLDRRVGNYVLPSDTFIIAAGNRAEDMAFSSSLMSLALMNRLVHFDVTSKSEDWIEWAMASEVAEEITDFIGFDGGNLFIMPKEFDYSKRAFPTPRSWETLSYLLKTNLDPIDAGSSTIGETTASKFNNYLVAYRGVDPERILNGFMDANLREKKERLYAVLMSVLRYLISKPDSLQVPERCINLVKLLEISPEFSISFLMKMFSTSNANASMKINMNMLKSEVKDKWEKLTQLIKEKLL